MSKKTIIASACGVVALGAATYLGGVYLTGAKLDDVLLQLDAVYSKSTKVQTIWPGSKLEYTKIDDSFFTQTGHIVISNDEKKLSSDVTFKKGFLNIRADLDTDELKKQLIEIFDADISPDNVDIKSYATVNGITSTTDIDLSVQSIYESNSKGTMLGNAHFTIDKDTIESNLNIDNLVSDDYSINSIKLNSSMKNTEDLDDVGKATIQVQGIKSSSYTIKNARLSVEAINQASDGSFDLKLNADGDNLFEYLRNYDVEIIISKLNSKLIKLYSDPSQTNKDEIKDKVLSTINSVKINKFNGQLGQIIGFFTGISNISEMNLHSTGNITWDYHLVPDSIKGILEIESDKQDAGERFFVKENGQFKAKLEAQGSHLLINGRQFM